MDSDAIDPFLHSRGSSWRKLSAQLSVTIDFRRCGAAV